MPKAVNTLSSSVSVRLKKQLNISNGRTLGARKGITRELAA